MNFFNYRDGSLFCEDIPLEQIGERFGTPCYVYSYQTLARHYHRLVKAWRPVEFILTYAVKANSNIAILRTFKKFGAWADVVSGGEIYRALRAGFSPDRIIFGGVGKTEKEIDYAVKRNIFMIVIDSEEELDVVAQTARRNKIRVNVALRINPDINPRTHRYIATGLKTSKFGIEMAKADQVYNRARSYSELKVIGIHHHIGSQVVEIEPFISAFTRTITFVQRLRQKKFPIEYVNIGGGIGITYKDETVFTFEELTSHLRPVIKNLGLKIMMEPGRVLVGNGGVLLTKVIYIKKTSNKNFVIVDAGMNDLIRPMLYNAYHEIMSVHRTRKRIRADVVGPICESGDFFAQDRLMPGVKRGDLIAIMSSGAYGFSMSSNYNSRPRCAEILVKGKRAYLIRERETWQDLIRGETIPRFLM